MVGLGGKERGLGESAKSKITSNIKNTVMRRSIGTSQAASIHHEYNWQILKRHFLKYLLVTASR